MGSLFLLRVVLRVILLDRTRPVASNVRGGAKSLSLSLYLIEVE